MSGSGQDTMVSSEVEVAVDPDTAFAAFTEELDLWWVRGPINHFAGGSHSEDRKFWIFEETNLFEHRGLVPVDALGSQLTFPEFHNRNQRNFHVPMGGSDARQHPGHLLCVRERKDHLIHKLVFAHGA